METALYYRLLGLQRAGVTAYVYFYYGGNGLNRFSDIPYHVSNHTEDFIRYVHDHGFAVVTFINTLHNYRALLSSGYKGRTVFECHGYHPAIIRELSLINDDPEGYPIDAVVVPSQYVAGMVSATMWKRPECSIVVMKNTLDTEVFTPRGVDKLHSLLRPLSSKNPIVGWVGRIEKNKNWRLLLRIMKKVRDLRPGVKFAVATDLQHSPDLLRFFEKLYSYGLQNALVFLGEVDYNHMHIFYQNIAQSRGVILSTSNSEGYPYNLLEAQACALTVVCTNAGGSTEIVVHGETGFVFPVGSATVAATELLEVLKLEELRNRLGRSGRQKVIARNNIDTGAGDYIRWLTELGRPSRGV